MNFYYYKLNSINDTVCLIRNIEKNTYRKNGNIKNKKNNIKCNIVNNVDGQNGFISIFSLTVIVILIFVVLIISLFLSLTIDIQKLENQVDTLALTEFTEQSFYDDEEYSLNDRKMDEKEHCEKIKTITMKVNAYLNSCTFVDDNELKLVIQKRPSSDFLKKVFPSLMVRAESRSTIYSGTYQSE